MVFWGHFGLFPASQLPEVAELGGRGGGAVLLLPGLGGRALEHALGRPREVEDGVDLAGGVGEQTHRLEIACKGTADEGKGADGGFERGQRKIPFNRKY